MASSALRSAAGFALVAAGSLLVLLAIERHAHETLEASATASATPLPHPPLPPAASAPPRATSSVRDETVLPAAPPSVSATTAPATAPASATASASGAPSSSATPTAGAKTVFRFAPGGITLTKDEIARLVAFAADLRRETGKIVIEGFADTPGTDEKIASLGRRRAVLARQVLTDVGLEGERLTIAVGDVTTDATLAGAVRITTTTRTP